MRSWARDFLARTCTKRRRLYKLFVICTPHPSPPTPHPSHRDTGTAGTPVQLGHQYSWDTGTPGTPGHLGHRDSWDSWDSWDTRTAGTPGTPGTAGTPGHRDSWDTWDSWDTGTLGQLGHRGHLGQLGQLGHRDTWDSGTAGTPGTPGQLGHENSTRNSYQSLKVVMGLHDSCSLQIDKSESLHSLAFTRMSAKNILLCGKRFLLLVIV